MKRALFIAIALIAALQVGTTYHHVADFPPPPLIVVQG